ncbi:hypothetical protein [Streptomyces anulatus]|uniref:hypothetical protein n=1 Tax=Streptomyces anulatus TaxID=1892 RepID=UPI002E801791|nr:hypothetical protein [Streptomyces anulatus]WUC89273.1 hypothetical protein OHQ35_25705 [Streptomyces anulatus]
MVKRGGKNDRVQQPLIVVAGEGDHDREVLRHLLPALLPVPRLLVEPIRGDKTDLSKADQQLSPRVDKLRRLAQAMAVRKRAQLMGIVVHVDFDAAIDERYHATRKRISDELTRAFSSQCDSALALAVSEMEGWLMLFPEVFPRVNKGWRLPDNIGHKDLGMIGDAKKHLKGILKQPAYSESHAPDVMKKAVAVMREHQQTGKKDGLDLASPRGRNQSYTDFVRDLTAWKTS